MGIHSSGSVIYLGTDKRSKRNNENNYYDDATQIKISLLLTYINRIKRMWLNISNKFWSVKLLLEQC